MPSDTPAAGDGAPAAEGEDRPEQQAEPQPQAQQTPPPQNNQRPRPKPKTPRVSLEKGPAVIVRYGLMRQIGLFRHNLKTTPVPGMRVVARTSRGVELSEVVACVTDLPGRGRITLDQLNDYLEANGPEYPFRHEGKVLREANNQDIIDQRHLGTSAVEERTFCRELVSQMDLPMRIVTVEHLLGGERIIFYFSSDNRVDFRELVRRLAVQYHTRIEMRQVGARDEARLVADYEKCGQRCCCQEFLKDLKPVSMRMAKTQKASLDPTKISGRCGRLMCCLRYEDASYEELRKKLPRKSIWVRTPDHIGRVVATQILTQLVQIQLPDRSTIAVSNEDIVARDVPEPTVEEQAAAARQIHQAAAERQREPRPQPAAAPPDQPQGQARRPARPRRGLKQSKKPRTPGSRPEPTAQPPDEGSGQPRKKKRRRRRGKRPRGRESGGQGGASPPA